MKNVFRSMLLIGIALLVSKGEMKSEPFSWMICGFMVLCLIYFIAAVVNKISE